MEDRYKIVKETAKLPFGTQFEATDNLISRKAQIHRFDVPGENAPSNWEEIYNKASGALTTLSHMGLPIIYDRGVNDEGPYLIRQLIEEPSLVSRLQQGPLSEYEVWELAQQLLDIHSAGVNKEFFHGSLDPNRVCYATRPGGEKRYYITDFGLAELHNRINGTSEYYGLPCLICRRQAVGDPPSEVSEIFSIGQLLYLCLADNHPFAANKVDEMVELHKSYPLAPVSEFRDDIPKPMVDWLVRMTAVAPSARFQTYAEALDALPAPIHTAPIPVIPTSTTQQQLQATPVVQTGTQGVVYGTPNQMGTAAQTMNAAPAASSPSMIKNPMVLGGIALAVALLIGGVMIMGGGDDDQKSAANATQTSESGSGDGQSEFDDGDDDEDVVDSGEGIEASLKKGLVVALNFDDSLAAKNNKSLTVEALKSEPIFAKGLYGKGLQLDQDHIYRLPLKGMLPSGYKSSFTISFWVNNLDEQEPAFISDQKWSSDQAHKVAVKDADGKTFWQWRPESEKESGGTTAQKHSWSMMTLVFSRKSKKITVYKNGIKQGSSSTDAIKTLDEEKYLYIGCDSRQKVLFNSPAIIDQFYIWDRKLSSKEIREMHKDGFTF